MPLWGLARRFVMTGRASQSRQRALFTRAAIRVTLPTSTSVIPHLPQTRPLAHLTNTMPTGIPAASSSTPATDTTSAADLELQFTPSLHPHLLVHGTPSPSPYDAHQQGPCFLRLDLAIPDALFPDPDELADLWGAPDIDHGDLVYTDAPLAGPSSSRLSWTLSPRVIDIERPLLPDSPLVNLTVVVPLDRDDKAVDVDIPLHIRYLPPSPEAGWDVPVFGQGGGNVRRVWVCGHSAFEGVQGTSPGGLSNADCSDVQDISANMTLHLPAAKPSYQVPVEIATATVVWLGWTFLVYMLIRVARRSSAAKSKAKETKSK